MASAQDSGQSFGLQEVAYVSRLSAIAVTPEEQPLVADKLGNILDLFAQMQAVDTDQIEPMAHPLDQTQRLRLDEVTEVDQHEKYQKLAPAAQGGLYLVPQVIE